MDDVLLFVYGTLRQGTDSKIYRWLAQRADLVGEATCQGKLYRIAHYPGVVESENPADVVQGELYRLRDPESVLKRLDQHEGCAPDARQPTEYVRRTQSVRLHDGQTVAAWVYVYNWPVDDRQWIASGDFLEAQRGDEA